MIHSGPYYPIQKINDKLYQIVAEFAIERVVDAPAIKEWLNCDVAFKSIKTNSYLFCRTIEDIEWEDITQ
jgi:hypothetical protein